MDVLNELQSGKSKLIYIYVESHKHVTIDDIKEELRFKLITIYKVINRIIDIGVVEKVSDKNKFTVRAISE